MIILYALTMSLFMGRKIIFFCDRFALLWTEELWSWNYNLLTVMHWNNLAPKSFLLWHMFTISGFHTKGHVSNRNTDTQWVCNLYIFGTSKWSLVISLLNSLQVFCASVALLRRFEQWPGRVWLFLHNAGSRNNTAGVRVRWIQTCLDCVKKLFPVT